MLTKYPHQNQYLKGSFFFKRRFPENPGPIKPTIKKRYYREDYTPEKTIIPRLDLLDILVREASKHERGYLGKTAFLGVQHILESTGTLFNSLIELGVKPENMYFTGKSYSTSQVVADEIRKKGIHLLEDLKPESLGEYEKACRKSIRKLWEEFNKKKGDIDRIIILDEEGRCIEGMEESIKYQYPIAGIEQTRGGLYSPSLIHTPFPVINVAFSAAKKHLESPFAAKAILKKIEQIIQEDAENNKGAITFGIIGFGNVGKEIARLLLLKGFEVFVYDKGDLVSQHYEIKFKWANTLDELLFNSNYIVGCSGKDCLAGIDPFSITSNKTFISASSEDREFLSFLKSIRKRSIVEVDPMRDIIFRSERGAKIKMANGGFPVNFDRSPVSIPSKDVALTRGLILAACLQALESSIRSSHFNEKTPYNHAYFFNKGTNEMLSPYWQRFVVNHWFKLREFKNEEYIEELIKKSTVLNLLSEEKRKVFKNELVNDFNKFSINNKAAFFHDIDWIKKNSYGTFVKYDSFENIGLKKEQLVHTPTQGIIKFEN